MSNTEAMDAYEEGFKRGLERAAEIADARDTGDWSREDTSKLLFLLAYPVQLCRESP